MAGQVWSFTPDKGEWERLGPPPHLKSGAKEAAKKKKSGGEAAPAWPKARRAHSAVVFGSSVLIFGGKLVRPYIVKLRIFLDLPNTFLGTSFLLVLKSYNSCNS